MALTETEDNGSWKRKHWIALCEELALEEAMDLSEERRQNQWLNVDKILLQRT